MGAAGAGGAPAKPHKEAPNAAAATPELALAQLRGVRPDKLALLFGRIHTAASADVAKKRAAQPTNPPKPISIEQRAAPQVGMAKVAAPPAAAASNAAQDPAKDPKAIAGAPDHPIKAEVPGGEAAKQAKQDEAAAQRDAVTQVVAAHKRSIDSWLSSWSGRDETRGGGAVAANMSESETQQLTGEVDQVPTSAADVSTTTGPAPELAMKTEAKGRVDNDRADLEKTAAALETLGRADSTAPIGEGDLEATAPADELTPLRPVVGAAAGPAAALPTIASAASSDEVGIVAQEQHGAEIDVALAKASADVTAERGKEAEEEAKARTDADTQIRELKTKSDAEQVAARSAAHAEVQRARRQWQAEIHKQGADARRQGDKKVAEGMAQVEAEEAKANIEATQHLEEGKRKADEEKHKGERDAADAKTKGKSRSSGFWGWASSKAKAVVSGIKKAVSSAIDTCRRAVKAVIATAKKLANHGLHLIFDFFESRRLVQICPLIERALLNKLFNMKEPYIQTLGEFGDRASSVQLATLLSLHRSNSVEDEGIRAAVLGVLTGYFPALADPSPVVDQLGDESLRVRREALRYLAVHTVDDAGPPLAARARDEDDPDLLAEVLVLLAKTDRAQAIAAAEVRLASTSVLEKEIIEQLQLSLKELRVQPH